MVLEEVSPESLIVIKHNLELFSAFQYRQSILCETIALPRKISVVGLDHMVHKIISKDLEKKTDCPFFHAKSSRAHGLSLIGLSNWIVD